MEHRATAGFWRLYDKLPQQSRDRADKQFSFLRANPQHPSLQFKNVGTQRTELWSARVTLDIRALATKEPYGYLWFWIGDHDAYDKLIA